MPATALLNWTLFQFHSYLLVLMRVAPILFLMPILSSRNLPNLLKVGLTLTVGFVFLPWIKIDPQALPTDPYAFAFFLIAELMIGFILAFSVKVVFAGIQVGGELISFQMGFSMANVVDPASEVNSPIISEFLYLLTMVLFLAVDGHHWFFQAVGQSFLLLPPGEIHLQSGIYRHFLHLLGDLFVIAIKIAAPVMAVLIFTQIALGILAKAVPQVNILMTSFPVTIGLGLLFLAFSLDLILPYSEVLFQEAGRGLVFTLLPLMRR
jgi:flagellar biosynthetic protein FliR